MIATIFESPAKRFIQFPVFMPESSEEVQKAEQSLMSFLPERFAKARTTRRTDLLSLYDGRGKVGDIVSWVHSWPFPCTASIGSADNVQKAATTLPAHTAYCGVHLTTYGWNKHAAGTLNYEDLTIGKPTTPMKTQRPLRKAEFTNPNVPARHPVTGQFVQQNPAGLVQAAPSQLIGQETPGTLSPGDVGGNTGVKTTEDSAPLFFKGFQPGAAGGSGTPPAGAQQGGAAYAPIYVQSARQQLMAAQLANHQVRVWAASTDGTPRSLAAHMVTAPSDLNPYVYASYAFKLAVMTQQFIEQVGRPPVIDGDALDADDLAFKQAMNTLTAQTWGDANDAPGGVQGGATVRYQPTNGAGR